MNALRRAGATATEEQRRAIEAWVEATYREAEALAQTEEQLRSLKATSKDVLGGLFEDLRRGVSASELLTNALNRVVEAMAKAQLDRMIDNIFAGGVPNIFGALFGRGFASGGYTGTGGKYQPAGVVHRGEYVLSAEATRNAGVANLDAIHKSLRGYSSGGFVGSAVPTVPRGALLGGSAAPVNVVVKNAPAGTTVQESRGVGWSKSTLGE